MRKSQFCKHGHDTFICGRTKNRTCKECKKLAWHKSYVPHPLEPKQFCPKGHDKDVVGKYKDGKCKLCIQIRDRIDPLKDSRLKEFCCNGHNITIVGRSRWRICNECIRVANRIDPTKDSRIKQLCVRGHDFSIVGRSKDGRCMGCRKDPRIHIKLANNLRTRLRRAIKDNWKTGSAVRDLGCTIDFLKIYLESLFLPGMTWENHGLGKDKWHIDHILPLDSFDLTDRKQFLQACHYTNLQPMWSIDNLRKSNKILV